MKKAFIIMTFSAMAAGCADNSIPKAQLPELDTSNPLLAEWDTPHQTPPFSEIELSDYEPAFDAAIACSRAEIDAIVGNPSKPSFGNTLVAWSATVRCWIVFRVFSSTCSKRTRPTKCRRSHCACSPS